MCASKESIWGRHIIRYTGMTTIVITELLLGLSRIFHNVPGRVLRPTILSTIYLCTTIYAGFRYILVLIASSMLRRLEASTLECGQPGDSCTISTAVIPIIHTSMPITSTTIYSPDARGRDSERRYIIMFDVSKQHAPAAWDTISLEWRGHMTLLTGNHAYSMMTK